MSEMKEFQPWVYHVFKDYDVVFDEKGATYGTLRKVQWAKSESEIDEAKAKLEIRKCYTAKDGEKTGKGYTFSTDDGPHELTLALIESGFGTTRGILKTIMDREDFVETVKTINQGEEEDDSNGEMFDMRDLLLNEALED